ncbi:MAG: MFS transporter [Planctomycetota bacterium]|nr:MAG: MFS transporter [Planctomycetota bacterium]
MFGATALNYMDRQSMALVEEPIRKEFGLDNQQFGWIGAAFYITYALAQVPAGMLADRLNVRKLYLFAVLWWSLAAMAAAFSPTLSVLIAMRILLGLGESFNWPCALKVTSRILPPSDRSLGNGIFNSGAAVGAVITPMLVPPLALFFGWRVAFAVLGASGILWILAWRKLVPPSKDEWFRIEQTYSSDRFEPNSLLKLLPSILIGACLWFWMPQSYGLFRWWVAATALFAGTLGLAFLSPVKADADDWFGRLTQVVRLKRFWVLVVVSITINVCWHFLVNWMPGYLRQDRGMRFLQSGLWVALPFLAADVGNLGGGWASRRLIQKTGWEPARARWCVMAVCAAMVSSGAFVGVTTSTSLALVLLAIMAAGAAGFMANYFAFCQEVSTKHTGLIVGILGGLGNLFAGGFLPYAGMIKDVYGSFGPIFIVVGMIPLIGLAVLGLGWGLNLKPSTDQ